MKFFTPELYRRYRSLDDAVADRAQEDWETATEKYRRHLTSFEERMPAQVRLLAQELCLHDATFLSLQDTLNASALRGWRKTYAPVVALSVIQDDAIVTLVYGTWGKVRAKAAPRTWHSTGTDKRWLYDEVDLAGTNQNRFWHRILFSDGGELDVPFTDVMIHRFAVNGQPRRLKKQRA